MTMFQMTVVFCFRVYNWFSPINLWQVEAEDLFDDFTLNIKDQLFGTAKELGQVELFVPATPWLVSANLLGKNQTVQLGLLQLLVPLRQNGHTLQRKRK